ncbi:MAG: hypothetical protein OSA06_05470 [Acidimicrobiales bacterium]|nr:hypothetical protein [Acidimicrobiales bacterium]
MEPQDTTPDVRKRQLEVYRSMAPAERVMAAFEIGEHARQATLDGLRLRLPDLDEEGIRAELLEVLHGELGRQVYEASTRS